MVTLPCHGHSLPWQPFAMDTGCHGYPLPWRRVAMVTLRCHVGPFPWRPVAVDLLGEYIIQYICVLYEVLCLPMVAVKG